MDIFTYVIIGYLVLVNLVAFIVFGVDKHKARSHKWSVSEKTLFFLAIIGGSIGAIAGMYTFRHKTRHWYFVIGMPLILILQLAGAYWLGVLPFQSKNEVPQTIEAPVVNGPSSGESDTSIPSAPQVVIPDYSGQDTILLNENKPSFTGEEIDTIQGESYSPLDSLGRCGVAVARLHNSIMPTEERGAIGHIRPSGWHTVKYPEIIKDRYLYNRCHLIAYALTGQNDNVENLITGTRYMNSELMLKYEMDVIHYVEDTDNHVLYRVRPFFKGNELVARGVEMEAYSVEDNGAGLSFHVFVYNVQPGIEIDYATGESKISE